MQFIGRERLDGLEVHRAGQTLAHERGVRGLVNLYGVDEFGRILVELDAAVLAARSLFATHESGAAEVRREAADGDEVGATVGALRRKAGQARQTVGDAQVRQ